MTVEEVKQLKNLLKAELSRRNGIGSVSEFATSAYDFTVPPAIGSKVLVEHGQKTVDLVLKIEDFGDLTTVKENAPIPSSFSPALIDEIRRLSAEPRTGVTDKTSSYTEDSNKRIESSSCRGMCTGLCVGTCTGFCNGCTGCSASCGTGCASGCKTTCKGGTAA